MDQFIQYLYEYEDGQRVRNLGFMKVENKMDKIEIQIYAKQLDEICGIYFKKNDGTHYIASWEEPQMQEASKRISDSVQQTTPQECDQKESEQTQQIEIEEIQSHEIQLVPLRTCKKIQRQDLSRLPRKEWKLANNNFLLHGYYNYHHLLYIEEDGKVWIGVPGVFHPKEKMAAEGFGFPEFRHASDLQTEIDSEDQDVEEDFGYWCRQVEHF